jgi:hypothetical protein
LAGLANGCVKSRLVFDRLKYYAGCQSRGRWNLLTTQAWITSGCKYLMMYDQNVCNDLVSINLSEQIMEAKKTKQKREESEKIELCQTIFDMMRESANSSSSACRSVGVAHSTFNFWIEEYGLIEQYTRAREDMIERIADETMTIADAPPEQTQHGIDSASVSDKKLRVDTRKWLLSKIARKKYGERLDHTSSDGSMSPIGKVDGFELVPLKSNNDTQD